jgi:competence protein ComGC
MSRLKPRNLTRLQLSNIKAVTLQELVVIIAILVVMASFAIVGLGRSVKNAYTTQEEAIVRMLSKAAVVYNTNNDAWVGLTSSQDIFDLLLDVPPPRLLQPSICGLDIFAGCPDNINWRLKYFPGPPIAWWLQCPHGVYGGGGLNKGTLWLFYPKGGKIVKCPNPSVWTCGPH